MVSVFLGESPKGGILQAGGSRVFREAVGLGGRVEFGGKASQWHRP